MQNQQRRQDSTNILKETPDSVYSMQTKTKKFNEIQQVSTRNSKLRLIIERLSQRIQVQD